MGIETWQPRQASSPAPDIETLDSLKKKVAACTACSLHCTRTQTVFGVGNPRARLMLIGEAPGFHEDRQGEPFVGRAGKLLDAMIAAIGFTRNDVYIANVLKCRPPENRDPTAEEVQKCTPFLQKQIAFIQPQLMLALGRVAAHYLLGTDRALGQMRQQLYHYGEKRIPLIVTYHPAYLLRQPADKARAWDDLLKAHRYLEKDNGSISATSAKIMETVTQ